MVLTNLKQLNLIGGKIKAPYVGKELKIYTFL